MNDPIERCPPPRVDHPRWARVAASAAVTFVVMIALSAQVCEAAAPRGPWKRVDVRDGIVISTRAVPGQNLPQFRGVGIVNGTLFDLLGIVNDIKRHCEWRANCHSARLVRKVNDFERIIYTRIDAPWPVSDRDVILRGKAMINLEKRIVTSHFHAIALRSIPKVSGVVRMPFLRGMYRFEELNKRQVRVTYQVYSDPGGLLPGWLAARSAKKLPYKTLMGLRKRVKKTRGQYDWMKKRYDPAHGGTIPARFLVGKRPAATQPAAPKP